MRNPRHFLEDIRDSCERVLDYAADLEPGHSPGDLLRRDGILFNLQIIGEAVKRLPAEIRETQSEVPWREIAGMRDVIAHAYFALDWGIIWDVVENEIPDLLWRIRQMLDSETARSPDDE